MFGLFNNNKDNDKEKDTSKKENPIPWQAYEVYGEKFGDTHVVIIEDNGNGYKSVTIKNTR